jgi:hypothetical protein
MIGSESSTGSGNSDRHVSDALAPEQEAASEGVHQLIVTEPNGWR